MIIGLLTNSPLCYTVRQLADIGESRGHEMIVVDYRHSYDQTVGNEDERASVIDYFEQFDAVFSWVDTRNVTSCSAMLRECEKAGAYAPNSSSAIDCACDRVWQLQTLTQADVPMPRTVIAHSTEDVEGILQRVGDGPCILKLLDGPHLFDRIVVADTRDAALIAIRRFRELDRDFIVQRFVVEAMHADIRVLVIGHSVIAAVSRCSANHASLPAPGDERIAPAELDIQERRGATDAARALDLAVADVTLLRSNKGPLVVDASPFPQLQWWDQTRHDTMVNPLFELIERRTTAN